MGVLSIAASGARRLFRNVQLVRRPNSSLTPVTGARAANARSQVSAGFPAASAAGAVCLSETRGRVREVLASVDWQVVSSVVARGLVSRTRIPCDGRRSGSLPCERLGTLHTQRK
jgi:hypothetical protein